MAVLNDITVVPNLKPFRDIDEHEVIGLFAHVSGEVPRGILVKPVSTSGGGNTNVKCSPSSPSTPYVARAEDRGVDGLPKYVYANRHKVNWTVDTATSGTTNPLGLTLDPVSVKNKWGEDYSFYHQNRAEGDFIPSGQAVPILVRGLVKIKGHIGTPDNGSGAAVSTTTPGRVDVVAYNRTTNASLVGKFLSGNDVDGYAILKLEL